MEVLGELYLFRFPLSALVQAESSPAPSLPREVCKELNRKVYNLSPFYLNTQRSGCSVRRRGTNSSDRVEEAPLHPLQAHRNQECHGKGKDTRNSQLDVLSLQYGKSLGSPMNNSEKEAFIQKEEKMPQ